jgi:DNA-binding LacI/PurR family transcriptional regulator
MPQPQSSDSTPQKLGINIADVAKAAGVSVATVSRVLNDKPDVAEPTRRRVQQVIDDLGYTPYVQVSQRAPVTNRTIALLYPIDRPDEELIDHLHLDFMIGAATAAGSENYLYNVMTNPITQDVLLGLYEQYQVEGVILMEIHGQDWRVELLRENDYPFVMIGRCNENDGLSYSELDFESAVVAAYDHLTALGHTEIGFINFPGYLRRRGHGPAVRGWQGFQSSVDKHQLNALYQEANYTIPGLYAATLQLLNQQPNMTAIVTLTDAPVVGVYDALQERGYRLPDEFSVVGLATDRIAELMSPSLTAVRFPAYDMGYQAAKMLIKKLAGATIENDQVLLNPQLVVRQSTNPKR